MLGPFWPLLALHHHTLKEETHADLEKRERRKRERMKRNMMPPLSRSERGDTCRLGEEGEEEEEEEEEENEDEEKYMVPPLSRSDRGGMNRD